VANITSGKKILRLLLASIVLSLISLILPWWNLAVFENGQLLAYFGLHLWGAVKTGFINSNFSFGWWSFATLGIVSAGCLSGLFAYSFSKTKTEYSKKALVLDFVLTLAGCIFYLANLAYEFSTFFTLSGLGMNLWTIGTDRVRFMIGIYSFFHLSFSSGQIVFLEFLSAGFFLAMISLVLLFVVLMKLPSAGATAPVSQGSSI
jgi:hypothetical protein